MGVRRWITWALPGTIALGVSLAVMAQGERLATQGIYSRAQAERGQQLYAEVCQRCHGASMEGLDAALPLTGPRFLGNYVNQPASALTTRIRMSMPLDKPGSLGLQASADLAAAILAVNGYPAGDAELPPGSSAQQGITLDPPR
jgi:mono/diheme cytochrome c family protein